MLLGELPCGVAVWMGCYCNSGSIDKSTLRKGDGRGPGQLTLLRGFLAGVGDFCCVKVGGMSENFEAVTSRDLYFENVGVGFGTILKAGTPVVVRDRSESEQVARHKDGMRVYEALVSRDDYRMPGEYDVDPELAGI